MLTGAPSDAAAVTTGRQGTCVLSEELVGVTDRWILVDKMGFPAGSLEPGKS